MKGFNQEELEKLTQLARIKCTKEEKKTLLFNLNSILDYVEQLKELDTENTKPCNHILETHVNVMRDDVVETTLSREDFIRNSPEHISGMIRVPPVLTSDQ
jgi:aspartyl-tRNA(Asn)/glutamyl-tRNA(Gln) amidotransferase subunit C